MTPRLQAIMELRDEIARGWDRIDGSNFREMYRQKHLDRDRIVELLKQEQMILNDEAVKDQARYFTNIVAVGFAGYFATWFIMQPKFSPFQGALIAFSGFLALTIFMLWDVFQMVLRMKEQHERARLAENIIDAGDVDQQLAAIAGLDRKYYTLKFRIWATAFALTVGSGLIGAVTMLFGIGSALLNAK